MTTNRLANVLAITVVTIWAISMIVDMIPGVDYQPPIAIYPALMLVLGAVFGVKIVRPGSGD